MRHLLLSSLLLVFAAFSGCKLIDAASAAGDKADKALAWIDQRKTEIDSNKDGKVSANELYLYLLGIVGLGGVAKVLMGKKLKDAKTALWSAVKDLKNGSAG